MPRPKGLPKTGGRQRGTPNKVTTEFREAAAAAGRTPLEHMMWVMNDEGQPIAMRNAMAVDAAPYLHPRVGPTNSSTAVQVNVGGQNMPNAEDVGIQVTFVRPRLIEHDE
jgi:hypothetical protein